MTDGSSWHPVTNLPDGSPVKICGLCVVDDDTVYAAGTNKPWEDAAVLKTTNGGKSWDRIDMEPLAASLIDIYFKDPQEGWVVGAVDTVKHPDRRPVRGDVIPIVLHTMDGGTTWTNLLEKLTEDRVFPQGEWGWKIQVLSDATMFVALENFHDGALLRSDDGGESWQRLRINDRQRNSNLEGIGFLDGQRGWVGGWGDLRQRGGFTSQTNDGGQNWTEANEVGFRLNRFRFIGDPVRVAYASGDTIYKFSDDPVAQAQLLAHRAETAAAVLEERDAVSFDCDVQQGTSHLDVYIWERFGDVVRILVSETNPAPGRRSLTWDFKNDDGEQLPPGPYFVRIKIDGQISSHLVFRSSKIEE